VGGDPPDEAVAHGEAMSRVAPLRDDEMSPEQRTIAADIAGARAGVLGGPFAIWLRVPEVAKRINAVSDRLRKNSSFEKRIVELIVLIVTRDWKAQYAWTAHAKQALEEGISPDVVEALRTHGTPAFARDDEQLIYDLFSELSGKRAMSAALYERGVTAFGIEGMIELVTTAGLYTMISMMLVSFDVPAANGERTLG
jgi:4-carboxymuconolactone decarboxylase